MLFDLIVSKKVLLLVLRLLWDQIDVVLLLYRFGNQITFWLLINSFRYNVVVAIYVNLSGGYVYFLVLRSFGRQIVFHYWFLDDESLISRVSCRHYWGSLSPGDNFRIFVLQVLQRLLLEVLFLHSSVVQPTPNC